MRVFNKNYLFGLITGILIMLVVGVYAAVTILASNISYSNSKTSATNVNDALNELYDKSASYKDPDLHGADPVLASDLLPVTISNDGTVTYASSTSKWYSYIDGKWANAIKLITSPSKTYNVGDTISESDISAYFVWIPRYRYLLWNVGVSDVASASVPRTISIIFESKDTVKSTGSTDGTYLTHPAFTWGNTELNGIWVSKFEITGSINSITSKPNLSSINNQSVSSFWNALKSYDTADTSHMMKNTEWGAVAYLTVSIYGKNSEVYINNNSNYLTGCGGTTASASSTTTCTNAYASVTSYPQSTTGNIYGVFDMSGGMNEDLAGCKSGVVSSSGLTIDIINANSNYFDIYNSAIYNTAYNYRILGDATGEMGPMSNSTSPWYGDYVSMGNSSGSFFSRGGACVDGAYAGIFKSYGSDGGGSKYNGSRMVLLS